MTDNRTPGSLDRPAESQPVVSPQDARQGITLHRMRYVLIFGLLLTVIAFVVVYLVV